MCVHVCVCFASKCVSMFQLCVPSESCQCVAMCSECVHYVHLGSCLREPGY